jgi:hypothetical protein
LRGDWNYLMSEHTPEPDSTGGESQKKKKEFNTNFKK